MEERGKEELRGLVGWRRWGSPTAMDTQTDGDRYKEERTGTGWFSDFGGVCSSFKVQISDYTYTYLLFQGPHV